MHGVPFLFAVKWKNLTGDDNNYYNAITYIEGGDLYRLGRIQNSELPDCPVSAGHRKGFIEEILAP